MKIKPFQLPIYLFFWWVLLSCGGRSEVDDSISLENIARQFIPDGAQEIVRAEGLPWVQLTFEMKGDTADVLYGEAQTNRARETGWRVCRSDKVDLNTFEDRSVSPSRERKQVAAVFSRGEVLVIIASLQDQTDTTTEQQRASVPTQNYEQHMVIARRASSADVEQTAQSLGVFCE
jgi:hypothetical protein